MALCKINLARCFQLVIIIPRLASNASEKNFFSNASEKNSSLHFFGSPHFSDLIPLVGEVATPPARSRFFLRLAGSFKQRAKYVAFERVEMLILTKSLSAPTGARGHSHSVPPQPGAHRQHPGGKTLFSRCCGQTGRQTAVNCSRPSVRRSARPHRGGSGPRCPTWTMRRPSRTCPSAS